MDCRSGDDDTLGHDRRICPNRICIFDGANGFDHKQTARERPFNAKSRRGLGLTTSNLDPTLCQRLVMTPLKRKASDAALDISNAKRGREALDAIAAKVRCPWSVRTRVALTLLGNNL